MRFFLDNNLSPQLALGMKAFGEKVEHLTDTFPPGTPDVDWLKYIGQHYLVLITRDENIRWNFAEKTAFRKYKVGAFFLGGKNRKACDLIQQLVRHWPRIKEFAHKYGKNRPYAFRIPPTGTKFTSIQL